MPLAGDVTAAVAGNPHATQMVGGGADVLSLMTLGAAYSDSGGGASQTYVSTAAFAIDLNQLPVKHDLQLAMIDATSTGTGFDSLRLEVIRGPDVFLDATFTDVATTVDMFNDYVFNFGDIDGGPFGNPVNLTIRLSVTTDEVDAGFRSLLVLANSPLAAFDGDFNNDGIVDIEDYVTWRNGLGGAYSQADYYVWRAQFGQIVPGSGSSSDSRAAVPEPAAWVILLIGLLMLIVRRRTLVSQTGAKFRWCHFHR